ncbi:MAG: hypothetical protein PHV30_11130 [Candidatus Margulisbacteria bacterium]|nr:hypothetical protein [Candidatus Margulisiibacteriota bacterium]
MIGQKTHGGCNSENGKFVTNGQSRSAAPSGAAGRVVVCLLAAAYPPLAEEDGLRARTPGLVVSYSVSL